MRERLIETAIRQFGELGFDGASTREIAAASGTTMSNITYHFGSKDGLFRAAGEAIVSQMGQVVSRAPAIPLSDNATNCERLDLICNILRHLGAFMLSDDAAPLAQFVAREQQNSCSHMRELLRRELDPVVTVVAHEIGQLRHGLSSEQCQATVFFLLGMTVSLRSSRLSLCVLMDVEDVNQALADKMLDRLDGMVRGAIMGDEA
ncbi:MAG: TetR family transcriptional regulator [Erythrobacter sp.]